MDTSDDPVRRIGKEISRSTEDVGREFGRFGKTIEKNWEPIAIGAGAVLAGPAVIGAVGAAEAGVAGALLDAGVGAGAAFGTAGSLSTIAATGAATYGLQQYQASKLGSETRKAEDAAFYRSQSVGPPATAGPNPTGPAASVPRRITPSGETRRKKQRAAASVLTRDWLPPTLGTPGLLGV